MIKMIEKQISKFNVNFKALLSEMPEFRMQTFQLLDHLVEESANSRELAMWEEYESFREELWGDFEETGVYILWNKDQTECYVGKCSQGQGSYLGKRIWSHFGTRREYREILDQGKPVEALEAYYQAIFPAYWLTVVAVPPRYSWIATAFEEYLIGVLPSMWNTVGRKNRA